MALTLNGIGKQERKARAVEALTKVGLKDQINKMPNQLSGGQMQRVAIARAIVNNPSIILADEPTGALDSKTSVQIMEILKGISKDRLIVMVTHNAEIASQYSTRIIRLIDGVVESDSAIYTSAEIEKYNKKEAKNLKKVQKNIKNTQNSAQKTKKEHKTSMNFWTALYLSFKNLLHKKGRTFLTSFAGSIGIIGVALVLAISNGFTNYINNTQKETLGNYPVTIATATIDYSSFTGTGLSSNSGANNSDSNSSMTLYKTDLQKYVKYGHYNYIGTNLVKKIKDYAEADSNKNNSGLNDVEYNYYLPLKLVSKNKDSQYVFSQNKNDISIFSGTANGTFYEAPQNMDFVMENYETIYSSSDYSSTDPYGLTLVVERGSKFKVDMFTNLGYNVSDYMEQDGINFKQISYQEICSRSYKIIGNDDYYTYDSSLDSFSSIDSTSQSVLETLYNNESSTSLKITRVLRKKSTDSVEILQSGVMYSSAFASEYLQNCENSEIYTKQMERKLSQIENNETNLTFYIPFQIDITEFSGMGLVPTDGFKNTDSIKSFLQTNFKTELKNTELFDLAMQTIGVSNIPQSISLYVKNFDAKTDITKLIDDYNNGVDSNYKVIYTDQSDSMMSALKNIISIISYVLIAFASISLIVSSIMIGIITYVSVIERTKEIGVLRSLGARKKDISRVFNAETIIIGFMAGAIGIAISYLFCPLINLIVGS